MTHRTRLTAASALATLLAATCLHALYGSGAWVVPTVLAVAAVAAGAGAARHLLLPRTLVPVAGLLGLLLLLVGWFAGQQALLWVLPTPAALGALRDLLEQGGVLLGEYAAPVPPEPGLLLLAAGGVGLLAVVVDTLAVTLRRPALAGLALGALWVVPPAVTVEGVGWVPFCLGAAGWLLLLMLDNRERVTRWGRQVDGTGRSAYESARPLGVVGRRVGAASLAAAVAVPALLPGLTSGLLDGTLGPGGGGGGSGGTTVDVSNPLIDLGADLNRPEDRELIRYRTTDESPGYLRLVVLDDFTGRTWAPTELEVDDDQTVQRGLAEPVGLRSGVATAGVTTDVEVLDYRTRWLPLPYPAQQVDVEGHWLWDEETFNVFSTDITTEDLDYRVRSLDVVPTAEQLRDAGRTEGLDRFLALPDGVPEPVLEAARERTRGAETPYDQALALQEWFRDPDVFTYDEEAPDGNGVEALEAFLADRRGFCVHFASAMAVMARSLGIPARVAVGFTPGQRVEGGGYSVGSHDAHAWPELYFEGVGWVPFEPTPAARTGFGFDWAQPEAPEAATPTPSAPTPAPTAAVPGSQGGADRSVDPLAVEGSSGSGGGGGPDVPWRGLGALALAALALLSPALARAAVRHRRWSRATTPAALAAAAWAELLDTAVDHGATLPPAAATPRRVAEDLAHQGRLGEAPAAAAARVARAAERLAYARDVGDVGDLRADVEAVEDALVERSGRRGSWRARLLPASLTRSARTGLDSLRARPLPARR
ncbi:transglutaminaseTgpA domain-containing protein [Vallicoccus soli]|uniref:Transglutaminase domain-containing protein n=1 Tax=Vallicoccus soli TaxID=2339232 RepID=A0A3A3Z532_9ACTN|nr:DUF3488 and transglutaminase-like domain-containing protein [Vallicoccus soli]RJK96828.1 transglutaminase domain-containing protein [Vallicoccus soli]